jgi:formylmethanofuran dehydrogenase subunit E
MIGHWDILGSVLGSLRYLGRCSNCGRQFMSTSERVFVTFDGRKLCAACARKNGAE